MIEWAWDPPKLIKDFKNFLRSVYDIEHIISSAEYRERCEYTLHAYPLVMNISKSFLKATKDIEEAHNIPIPDYGKAICFPYRFLRKPSVSTMQGQGGEKLSNALDEIFFTGLNFHFFWSTFPTRKEYQNVDVDALKSKWLLEALLADKTMGRFYQGQGGQMANNIFAVRYSTTCEPLLKEEIKISFFKRGMCKSFFRNIYWAGALLGVQYDMATK
ncbi:MAG: hypothetical protein A2Y97_13160 [Nitrospirae bacterium RBG_13_39_12]|nr:MAG: hypothetical protein A2Y97_13160 [Nitrospirae bacterium RBG_13_39_12]